MENDREECKSEGLSDASNDDLANQLGDLEKKEANPKDPGNMLVFDDNV